jgi:hypothetical protein
MNMQVKKYLYLFRIEVYGVNIGVPGRRPGPIERKWYKFLGTSQFIPFPSLPIGDDMQFVPDSLPLPVN